MDSQVECEIKRIKHNGEKLTISIKLQKCGTNETTCKMVIPLETERVQIF